ncbi:histidine phosphatase family protein, partial [Roseburia faecis]|nr:histidine phosphatase family protein [Roseburia faecis]
TYLTDEGRAQAQLLAQNFDLRDFDALYVSPLERTKQTAAILNEEAQLPVIEDKRLLEISYGDWDGQPNDELMNQYP